MTMDFKALQAYADETFDLFVKHSKDIVGSEPSASDVKQAREIIEVLGDMDTLKLHYRHEGGQVRGSIHFKTR